MALGLGDHAEAELAHRRVVIGPIETPRTRGEVARPEGRDEGRAPSTTT